MSRKVPVSQLTVGMYVRALDRPWLESPFMFQGFIIESHEQMATLRQYCQYVYVDDEKAVQAAAGHAQAEPDPRVDGEDRTSPPSDTTIRTRRIFRQDVRRMLGSREKLHVQLTRIFQDARFGHSIDTRESRLLVEEMVETVTGSPATALWLTNLQSKHEYTASHCLNACIFSIAFGAHLGLSKDYLSELGLGALLHDVGKMRTPLSVLDKPGVLTEDEFDVIKKHTTDGYNLLRKHKDIPQSALDIVQLHHERIGGHGYPMGLKGDEIPQHVRIVAIADVYDDMTSNRIYHEGIPGHAGLNMMFQWAPRDFGEDLMQEFIRCVGIYPIGSLVELNTGALGIVMSTNSLSRLKPVVMLLRDRDGRDYERRPLLNLAAPAAQEDRFNWKITRVVDCKDYGIDLGHIAEQEALL
ncbi:MAG TPA: HD-GYP domain-containing protein [Gammaproteobacteria bacterium]|nr:HD-GYP domain-containing protein [Gammaproteobacteria bacterium]